MTLDLLTVSEAAALLKVKPDTLRFAIRRGDLQAVKLGPRQWRIARADLTRYAGGAAPSTSTAPVGAAVRLRDAVQAVDRGEPDALDRVLQAARLLCEEWGV
jgi:excisionase family DNA binding protein